MNANRDKRSFGLPLTLLMAAAVLTGVLVMGDEAAARSGGRETAVEAASVHSSPVLGPIPSAGASLFARKGRKGGAKFEHGRPGHTAAPSEGSLIARRGAEKPEKPEKPERRG